MSINLFNRHAFEISTSENTNNQTEVSGVGLMIEDFSASDLSIRGADSYSMFKPLPPYSTILGICNDGLPLLLDLNDPSPGAILITGNRASGALKLLRSILYSACNLNDSKHLYFYLISPNPGNHYDLRNLDNCYGLYSSYDRAAHELLVDLAALVEQRKSGRHLGAKCILAIDNLYELIKHREHEFINHLKWLYRFGSNNGIWVVSTLETERFNLIEDDLIHEQKTHIQAGNASQLLPATAAGNSSGREAPYFQTRIGKELIDFWLP